MNNFKLIPSRYDPSSCYLFSKSDECLYKKNGNKVLKDGSRCQYYKCIDCEVTGKVFEGTQEFLHIRKNNHTHEAPKDFTAYKRFINEVKEDVTKNSRSAREIYDEKLSRYDVVTTFVTIKQNETLFFSVSDAILERTSFNKIVRGLNKLQSRKFPTCLNVNDLDNVLKNIPSCRKEFGTFRNEIFYQGLLQDGNSCASIFLCKQITAKMDQNNTLYVDGTFGVLPLGLKQLLIIMTEVGNKVVKNVFINTLIRLTQVFFLKF